MNKSTLGTIVGTALLGLAKKHSGSSSSKLKVEYNQVYFFTESWAELNLADILRPSHYRLVFERDEFGYPIDEDSIDWTPIVKLSTFIENYLKPINETEIPKIIEKVFNPKDYEEIVFHIYEASNSNIEYIESSFEYEPDKYVSKEGELSQWAISFEMKYEITTFNKNEIPTLSDVRDLFQEVIDKVYEMLQLKYGMNLERGNLDDTGEDFDQTIMIQTKEGDWVPYKKPETIVPRLRNR